MKNFVGKQYWSGEIRIIRARLNTMVTIWLHVIFIQSVIKDNEKMILGKQCKPLSNISLIFVVLIVSGKNQTKMKMCGLNRVSPIYCWPR